MTYIKYYEMKKNNTKNLVKVDSELFNANFSLSNNLPYQNIASFEFGNEIFIKKISRKETILSLTESKFYAPLDFFINKAMKEVETSYIEESSLETIKGHMTTIMSLRGVGDSINKNLLVQTYEKLLDEIEKVTGEIFDYKNK